MRSALNNFSSLEAAMSNEVPALMKRYKDAYIVARVTNRFGWMIKAIGIIVAVLLVLVGFMVANNSGPRDPMSIVGILGIAFGVFTGALFYIIGVLVSAQGQTLMASLDSAVNSSPFLTNEHRAKIMSLTQEDTASKGSNPPKDSRSHKKVSKELEGYLAEVEKRRRSY